MDLVYECFVKLGLRYICVTKEGRFAGVVSYKCMAWCELGANVCQTHKKTFARYVGIWRRRMGIFESGGCFEKGGI